MKIISFEDTRSLRKERNRSILRKMENGESLTSFNSFSSWYPPRPVIAKNESDVRKLYGRRLDRRLSKSQKDNDQNDSEIKAPSSLILAE